MFSESSCLQVSHQEAAAACNGSPSTSKQASQAPKLQCLQPISPSLTTLITAPWWKSLHATRRRSTENLQLLGTSLQLLIWGLYLVALVRFCWGFFCVCSRVVALKNGWNKSELFYLKSHIYRNYGMQVRQCPQQSPSRTPFHNLLFRKVLICRASSQQFKAWFLMESRVRLSAILATSAQILSALHPGLGGATVAAFALSLRCVSLKRFVFLRAVCAYTGGSPLSLISQFVL